MPVNVPTTIYRPSPPGSGEMTSPGSSFIVDNSANFLVDNSGNFIVDTGQLFTQTPTTIYVPNDAT
jgi:hypothetical protein